MGVTISYEGDTIASMSSSGSKTLLTSGKYCEGNITVDYQGSAAVPCKSFTVTLASDQTAKTYLTAADNDIVSHMGDTNFWVAVIPLFGYSSGVSFRGGINTNIDLRSDASNPTYGFGFRTNSSGQNGMISMSRNATASGADVAVDSTGRIFVYATSSVVLKAGDYLCLCGW